MKKFCIVLITSFILVLPTIVFSQSYLPIGIMPMEYNSSFAGSAGNARISSSIYYGYYTDEPDNRTSYGYYASYDKFIPKLRSGIGIKASGINSFVNSTFWDETDRDRTFNISAIIAPKISIKGKYTISPSLELGYNNFLWEFENPYRIRKSSHNGFTSNVGILFNASNYYIGYTARIYQNEDNRSDYWAYNLYSAFQFGCSFQKSVNSRFSFTPQVVFPLIAYQNSFEWYWPSYNLSFRYDHFIFGLINQFTIPYPTGFQLGWQKNGWRFLLSNQFKDNYSNDSKVDYTANFSLRYIFNQDKKSIHIMERY